jgi:hypothetical protein
MRRAILSPAAGLVAVLLMGVATGGPAAAAPRCAMADGRATMITRDLAEFLAKAALASTIREMGAKPVGKLRVSCQDGFTAHCVARQKACK